MTNKTSLPATDFELPPNAVKPRARLPETPVTEAAPSISNPEPLETSSEPKKPLYHEEELLRVFDEIIFSGEYVESYTIRNRFQVTFRTRTAEETMKIQKSIDSGSFNLISTVDQTRSLLTLESALTFYDGKDLNAMKPEQRSAFISKLPGPVINLLLNTLAKFDNKVFLACQQGEENF